MPDVPPIRRAVPPLLLGVASTVLRLVTLPAVGRPGLAETRAVGTLESIGGPLPIPADPSLSDAWLSLLSVLDQFTPLPVVTAGSAPAVPPDPDPLIHAGRLMGIVLASVAVALVAAAGARRGETMGAWVAGGLVALSPLAFDQSLTGGAGSLFLVAAAGLVWALAGERGALAGGFGGLAAATGGGGVGLLAGLPVSRLGSRRAWAVAAGALLLLAPGVVPGFPQLPRGGLGHGPATGSPLWGALWILGGAVGLPALLLAVGGIVRAFRNPGRANRGVAAATLAAVGLALLRRGADPAALTIAVPGLALLATGEIVRLTRSGDMARARLILGLALLFPVLGLGRAVANQWIDTPREAAEAWVRMHVEPNAPILMEDPDLDLPTAEGARQLNALVQAGRLDAARLATYVAPGKTFAPVSLTPPVTEPMEPALFYDPNLAESFQWMILKDLPVEEDESETAEVRTCRKLFHEYFRSAWTEAARFPAGPEGGDGLTILHRPEGFELDLEALGKIGFVLTRRHMLQLRERSQAFTDWALLAGQAFLEAGETKPARSLLGMASEREPDNPEARFQFALALALLGSRERAQEELLQGLALDPYHGGIHYQLGVLLEEQDDLEGAEVEYRAAIEYQEDPQFARASLGGLLVRQGDLTGAAEQLAILRREHPNAESTRYLAGILPGS